VQQNWNRRKFVTTGLGAAGVALTAGNLSLFGEALPQQPKDYYVEMASLNLLTYGIAYRLEPDPVGKMSLAANMAFISFNYFVQKEKGVIRWSAAYEKAIKISYAELKVVLTDDPYLNPCGWEAGAEKPKLQFPKSHRLTYPEYEEMTKKFIEFLKL